MFTNFRKSKPGTSSNFVSTLRKKPGNSFLKFNGRDLNNRSLKNILENAQFKKRKSLAADKSKEDEDEDKMPEFDCNAGLNLSDGSDDDDFEDVPVQSKKPTFLSDENLENSINENTANTAVDFQTIQDNYRKFEQAREKMKNYKKPATTGGSQKEKSDDIAGLLAMGESSAIKKASLKRSQKEQNDDSDSDDAWEDVEGKRVKLPRYKKILKHFEYDG